MGRTLTLGVGEVVNIGYSNEALSIGSGGVELSPLLIPPADVAGDPIVPLPGLGWGEPENHAPAAVPECVYEKRSMNPGNETRHGVPRLCKDSGARRLPAPFSSIQYCKANRQVSPGRAFGPRRTQLSAAAINSTRSIISQFTRSLVAYG